MNIDKAIQLAWDLRPSARRRERAVRRALPLIQELDGIERAHWKPRLARLMQRAELVATPGLFFQDARPPWLESDVAAVTLATTMKQLWSTPDFTATYATDWWTGRLFMIRAFGRITTAATPGNLTVQLGYGTADGTTGALATSGTLTLIASQTNKSWRFEGRVRCRDKGSAGSAGILLGTGILEISPSVVAAGQGLVPDSAAAQVGSLNLAATSGIHLQFARSGSTAETAQVHDLEMVAQN